MYHDEQFPHCDGESNVRLMMMDVKYKYPYHNHIEDADKFDNELIETYFHKILDNIPHEIIITDEYKAYPSIIEKFGMKHQRCVFHIMQNLGKDIFPTIRELKRENKSKENKIDKEKKATREKQRRIHTKKGENIR